jgi:thiosulfate dehydrogenase (quinone) large subunit
MSTSTLPRALSQRIGPLWSARLSSPGVLLLPLRAFLGATFTYAGLQKLANPAYLDPHSPTSVVAQMHALRNQSPIGPLLSLTAHAPTLVGLLIEFGELAVGVGTLLGLRTRLAAAGGLVLALSFFLTVSWNTTPYYFGSDIVFVFAWTVLLGFGSGDVLSLDAWLRNRARAATGLGPEPAMVPVAASRLRSLCDREAKCGLDAGGVCSRQRGCPVFPTTESLPPARRGELDRRTALASGAGLAGVGLATAVLAGTTAGVGRLLHHDRRAAAAPGGSGASTPASAPTSGRPATSSAKVAPHGVVVAQVSAVPVGQAKQFTDPNTGGPAWLVHTSGDAFAAFSAVCTHAGCTVGYDPSSVQFVCPCHGGTFDARTGDVTGGPPPQGLPAIPVQVTGGSVTVT